MSWLSAAIHKIGQKISGQPDPPKVTVGTVLGTIGTKIAPKVGEATEEWLTRVSGGQSAGDATKALVTGATDSLANTAGQAAAVLRTANAADSTVKALLASPVAWVVLGLLIAHLLSRGKR